MYTATFFFFLKRLYCPFRQQRKIACSFSYFPIPLTPLHSFSALFYWDPVASCSSFISPIQLQESHDWINVPLFGDPYLVNNKSQCSCRRQNLAELRPIIIHAQTHFQRSSSAFIKEVKSAIQQRKMLVLKRFKIFFIFKSCSNNRSLIRKKPFPFVTCALSNRKFLPSQSH